MERRIALEGCHNFRDLGGYPTRGGGSVRWRMLFRSDALHHLTPAGMSRFRDELRIGCVIDLRSSGEVERDGRGPLGDPAAGYHHLPLFDGAVAAAQTPSGDLSLGDRYALLARFAAEPIARVVTALAGSDAPAVYHCAAGKDRTGVVSAVLLGLLGVPDEIIVADYAASQENLDAIVERLLASEGYQEMLAALPPDTLHAEPQTMLTLLASIREGYGSMRDYARAIGVADAAVDRLVDRLVES